MKIAHLQWNNDCLFSTTFTLERASLQGARILGVSFFPCREVALGEAGVELRCSHVLGLF